MYIHHLLLLPQIGSSFLELLNRFTIGGFTVTRSTFQMACEVIEKQGDCEVAFRWFPSKQKAENFCLGRIGGKY